MRLTNKSEYALLALVFLARNTGNTYTSLDKIAKTQNISIKFLEQIMAVLKRARYVKSLKGPGGGYQLAKPAKDIYLADIIRLLDGALAPTDSVSHYFYESTPIEKEPGLINVFKDIRDYISDKLEQTTLSDVSQPITKQRKQKKEE